MSCARSFVVVALVTVAVAGCVGAEPTIGSPGSDASPSSETHDGAAATSDATTADADEAHDGASPADAQAPDASLDAGTDDATTLPDAGPSVDASDAGADTAVSLPTVTCVDPAMPTGAFNFRCSAAAVSPIPGGTFPIATYLLTRVYGASACGTYNIGWAQIFASGADVFLRYERYKKADASGAGTKVSGTSWLRLGANNTVQRTELCDPARIGTTETLTYSYDATSGILTFTFPASGTTAYQEGWTKQ